MVNANICDKNLDVQCPESSNCYLISKPGKTFAYRTILKRV